MSRAKARQPALVELVGLLEANITWKRGERLGSRAGWSRSTSSVEGIVLVLEGLQRRLARAGEQVAKVGESAQGRVRRTSGLTK